MDAISTSNQSRKGGAVECLPRELIIKANAQFWEQMVAMRLEPVQPGETSCSEPGDVLSSVGLSGAWCGQVDVRMERGLAVAATAAMLLQEAGSVTDADMLDAAREIANMIAGVLKVSLPKPCAMSLPHAEVARDGGEICSQWSDAREVGFHHEAGEMVVRVLETDGGPAR